MSTSTSGVRPIVDKGQVAYVVYNMSLGRDINKVRMAWEMMEPEQRYAWRAAAEAVLDEDWIESGGRRESA